MLAWRRRLGKMSETGRASTDTHQIGVEQGSAHVEEDGGIGMRAATFPAGHRHGEEGGDVCWRAVTRPRMRIHVKAGGSVSRRAVALIGGRRRVVEGDAHVQKWGKM